MILYLFLAFFFVVQDLAQFGVDPDNIMNGILDANYKDLMKYQIARARFYYKQAARGIPMLAPESRLPVQVGDHKKKQKKSLERHELVVVLRG